MTKLKNILVTDSNDIVISDFGFARDGDSNTMFDTLCGSPMYMAPEIMTHKSENLSDKARLGFCASAACKFVSTSSKNSAF